MQFGPETVLRIEVWRDPHEADDDRGEECWEALASAGDRSGFEGGREESTDVVYGGSLRALPYG